MFCHISICYRACVQFVLLPVRIHGLSDVHYLQTACSAARQSRRRPPSLSKITQFQSVIPQSTNGELTKKSDCFLTSASKMTSVSSFSTPVILGKRTTLCRIHHSQTMQCCSLKGNFVFSPTLLQRSNSCIMSNPISRINVSKVCFCKNTDELILRCSCCTFNCHLYYVTKLCLHSGCGCQYPVGRVQRFH